MSYCGLHDAYTQGCNECEWHKELYDQDQRIAELEEEIKALHHTSDLYNDEINALKDEIAEKDAEIARLRDVLTIIAKSFYGATNCPNCGEAASIAEDALESSDG